MRLRIVTAIVVLGAGLLGFWYGSYRSERSWRGSLELAERNLFIRETRNRARTNLHVLTMLQDGHQSEAREALERQLSVAVTALAANWNSTAPDDRDYNEVFFLRDIRAYRLQHPWTNDPSPLSENVQSALKLADLLPE